MGMCSAHGTFEQRPWGLRAAPSALGVRLQSQGGVHAAPQGHVFAVPRRHATGPLGACAQLVAPSARA